jgi:hypothetical protein
MFALNDFATASPAYIAHEEKDGTFTLEPEANGEAYWLTRAYGTRHTDPSDACDPVTTTRIVQLTDEGWLRGIVWNLEQGPQDNRPTEDGEPLTIEEDWRLYLKETFTPSRCWCSHDCCGHRHGYASVTHLGGAVFCIEVRTSRNY